MGMLFIVMVIIALVMLMIILFMEGYYIGRYNNMITRFWREHIVGEDIW